MNSHEIFAVGVGNNRAEYRYIHSGTPRTSTAFDLKEKADILLNIPRSLGTTEAFLEIYDESLGAMVWQVCGEWQGFEGDYDEDLFEIPGETIGTGLYFMRPRLSVFGGNLFGHRWAGGIYFDKDYALTNMMQLTLCRPEHKEPRKLHGGIIYHIFVDRFNRGGSQEIPDGARIVRGRWKVIPEYPEYPGVFLKNNKFYGGTLWGIIDKLDYIKSLGTKAIYLSPIFSAASNHKYDTADYMTVDPIFGGEEAFKALLSAANEKGIEIILDGVFNHTGSDSIYFNRYGRYRELGAYQSKRSAYFDWYDFQEYPNKYTSWWGIEILPRINPDKPECGEYFVGKGGVIDKYSKMGVYGFRLDVADELSDDFISKIKGRLSSNSKDNILYGEVWEDASNKSSYGRRKRYYLGAELDGVMNYPVRKGIIDYLTRGEKNTLAYALTDVTENAPEWVLHNQMNLLGTHDTERILTILGGESAEGKSNSTLAYLRMDNGRKAYAIKKLMCAYTILATLPGIPTVFYGDEAGLEGYGDPFNRMPYPWGNEDNKLLSHYRALGQIRSKNSAYKKGDFKLIHLDESLLVFSRGGGAYRYITVVNNGADEISLSFDAKTKELISDTSAQKHIVEANTAKIFKVKNNSEMEIG